MLTVSKQLLQNCVHSLLGPLISESPRETHDAHSVSPSVQILACNQPRVFTRHSLRELAQLHTARERTQAFLLVERHKVKSRSAIKFAHLELVFPMQHEPLKRRSQEAGCSLMKDALCFRPPLVGVMEIQFQGIKCNPIDGNCSSAEEGGFLLKACSS